MPKAKTIQSYYAVAKGRVPGVYESWGECETQVRGFAGASYKKFKSSAEAESFAYGKSPKASSSTTQPVASSSTHRMKPYNQHQSSIPTSTKGKQRALESSTLDRSGWLTVYSDGACKGNGKANSVAGVGVWWGAGDPRNLAERCPGGQTNNRAELIAIVRLLETAPKSKQPLFIRTDSTYSIKCFKEWLPKWRKNKFKTSTGGEVNNLGIIKYIDALLTERAKVGQKVELDYVKGHAGHEGNEGADALANQGCLLPEVSDRDWEALEEQVLARIQSYQLGVSPDQSVYSARTKTKTSMAKQQSPVHSLGSEYYSSQSNSSTMTTNFRIGIPPPGAGEAKYLPLVSTVSVPGLDDERVENPTYSAEDIPEGFLLSDAELERELQE